MAYFPLESGAVYWKIASENYQIFNSLQSAVADIRSEDRQAARSLRQEKRVLAGIATIFYTAKYLEFASIRYLVINRGVEKAERMIREHRGIKGKQIPIQRWRFGAYELTGVDYINERKISFKMDELFKISCKLTCRSNKTLVNEKFVMPPFGISKNEYLIFLDERELEINKVIESTKDTVCELATIAATQHELALYKFKGYSRALKNQEPPLVEVSGTGPKYKPRFLIHDSYGPVQHE